MKVRLCRSSKGVLEARCEAPSWDDFQMIIRHLMTKFGARVVNKTQGPDARAWRLSVDGKEVVVHQWDIGDLYIFPTDSIGEDAVTRIAHSLEQLARDA